MSDDTKKKKKYAQIAVAAALLIGLTLVFIFIGATGPKSSQGSFHAMYMCVVPNASDHVWNSEAALVDHQNCEKIGRRMVREEEKEAHLKHYPLKNIVFYTKIPYLHGQVMSRQFEFLLADLGIHFVLAEYLREAVASGDTVVKFEVVLGYRDSLEGPWKRKVTGNVSRTLRCGYNMAAVSEIFTCDHFPLFELGSCHHKQYIVNLFFTKLPLDQKKDFSGLSQLDRLSLYEIHQSPGFTSLWLMLKSVFCPVSLVLVCWFLHRYRKAAAAAAQGEGETTLVARFLAFLGCCLVFYNVPFQYISLFFDCPWLLVLHDFQQGLFIAALFAFWILFISEHSPDRDCKSHIGSYWKQMGLVFVASIFLFVYEFCERGIQVMYPFYSLWTSKFGVAIAWTFISISAGSALLYLLLVLLTLVRVMRQLRRKQAELSSLSPSAREKFSSLFTSLRFFLGVTCMVAVCSVLTVVLPSEVMLHHWQHDTTHYNVYTGILTGNYGMWNAYCLVMMWIYAPSSKNNAEPARGQNASPTTAATDDAGALQKLITKKSLE